MMSELVQPVFHLAVVSLHGTSLLLMMAHLRADGLSEKHFIAAAGFLDK